MIISGNDVRQLLDDSGLKPSTFANKLGISTDGLNKAMELGVQDTSLRRRLQLLKHNLTAVNDYTFDDLAKLTKRLNWDEADMRLVLDVSPSTWHLMRTGKYRIRPHHRKIARLIEWFQDEGLDPIQHVGLI